MSFHDLCIRNKSEDVLKMAEDLGWISTGKDIDTVFLDADDWGELKRSIDSKRSNANVLVFEGGDEELNRKVVEDSRIDILLHPEKGRKDSGINHVVAEKAAENCVAIGFDLKQLLDQEGKYRSFVLKHWRRNLKLCEKFDTPYVITSGARDKYELRAPRDLSSIIDSLGFEGSDAVSRYPEMILERSEQVNREGSVRPGVEEK